MAVDQSALLEVLDAYDRGEGRRQWRALDLDTRPSSKPKRHGSAVVRMGRRWRRCPGTDTAGPTYGFDEVAWLATQCYKTAITELMWIAWRTVGAIITWVWADVEAVHDRFADLRRIGIDEIASRLVQKYLTRVAFVFNSPVALIALAVLDLGGHRPSPGRR